MIHSKTARQMWRKSTHVVMLIGALGMLSGGTLLTQAAKVKAYVQQTKV